MADEEKGFRWWIRYVIVPLMGGGVVAAIVTAKLNQPKPPTENSLNPGEPSKPIVLGVAASPHISQAVTPSKSVQQSVQHNLPGSDFKSIPTKVPQTGPAEYVVIRHSRELSSAALLLDGQKPGKGVLVDGGEDSPMTKFRLPPGQYRLSVDGIGKTCSTVFSVPANSVIPFPCDIPFKGGDDAK